MLLIDELPQARCMAYNVNRGGRQPPLIDDTGFTADGEFVDEDVLLHGGMALRRER